MIQPHRDQRPSWQKPAPGAIVDVANPLARGLAWMALFAAGAGTQVVDRSASAIALTAQPAGAGPTWGTGPIGPAMRFASAGSQTLVSAPTAALNGGTGSITFAARVRFDALGAEEFLLSTDGEYSLWLSHANGDKPAFRHETDSGVANTSRAAVSTGVWYAIRGWYDAAAGTVNVQTDNGPINSKSYVAGAISGARVFGVGAWINSGGPAGNYLNGSVDWAAGWTRALSNDEWLRMVREPFGLIRRVEDRRHERILYGFTARDTQFVGGEG